MDARWTKKNNNVFYEYKNHVKADTKTKLIEEYIVIDASVHDSQAMEQLLTEKDKGLPLYADSAYIGEEQDKIYKKKKVISKINEKGKQALNRNAKLLFHRVNLTYNICRCTQLKIVVVMEYLPAGRQGYVQA